MNRLDAAVERYDAGDTWHEDEAVVQLEAHPPLDKIMPIRLSDKQWQALRARARGLGLGPSTLARMWLLERLDSDTESAPAGTRDAGKPLTPTPRSAAPSPSIHPRAALRVSNGGNRGRTRSEPPARKRKRSDSHVLRPR
jgi:hypothetical protein